MDHVLFLKSSNTGQIKSSSNLCQNHLSFFSTFAEAEKAICSFCQPSLFCINRFVDIGKLHERPTCHKLGFSLFWTRSFLKKSLSRILFEYCESNFLKEEQSIPHDPSFVFSILETIITHYPGSVLKQDYISFSFSLRLLNNGLTGVIMCGGTTLPILQPPGIPSSLSGGTTSISKLFFTRKGKFSICLIY